MGFANAAGTHKENAMIEDGKLAGKPLGVIEGVRLRPEDVINDVVVTLGVVIGKGAALIASGNSRLGEEPIKPVSLATTAGTGPDSDDNLPACSLTILAVHWVKILFWISRCQFRIILGRSVVFKDRVACRCSFCSHFCLSLIKAGSLFIIELNGCGASTDNALEITYWLNVLADHTLNSGFIFWLYILALYSGAWCDGPAIRPGSLGISPIFASIGWAVAGVGWKLSKEHEKNDLYRSEGSE